jgi:2-polyprenyl-3-methyl-5-hydroxy-6-metoxy-1,4-benzoquinol methylase
MTNYDEIFEWYVQNRSGEIGVTDIQKFTLGLPASAKILDLGCGDGFPISSYLFEHGFDVFAIDSSKNMIERYKERFPDVPTECAEIQHSSFFDVRFNAVIAYGVVFHLNEDDQASVLIHSAKSLLPGGKLLFTSQKEEIHGTSTMNGINFPYISLGTERYSKGTERYSKILQDNGMKLEDEYCDQWDNYIYVYTKPPLAKDRLYS